jgi:hypothetical protein
MGVSSYSYNNVGLESTILRNYNHVIICFTETGIPLYYKLKELQLEKVVHRKTCISKEYILIHFDSTTTTYYKITMECCNSCYIKLLYFFGLRTRPINLRTLSPGSSRIFHSIKYFLYFLLLCLIVYYVILPFWQSLTRCDLIPYILVCIVILCVIYISIMTPIFLSHYYLQDNMFQNITRIQCIFIISYIMIFIFLVILPTITYNNDVIIQQDDKVYQCVRTYKLPLQAYPVVLDFNSSVIEEYRGHGHSCDLSSYGPIFLFGQTLEASPNYLKYNNGSRFFDAFVCKHNDPKGCDLCRRYISVSSRWKFLWSLICNCISDRPRSVNGGYVDGYAGVVATRCLWNRCIWIIVSQSGAIYRKRTLSIY